MKKYKLGMVVKSHGNYGFINEINEDGRSSVTWFSGDEKWAWWEPGELKIVADPLKKYRDHVDYYLVKFPDGTKQTIERTEDNEKLVDAIDDYNYYHDLYYCDFWDWQSDVESLKSGETLNLDVYDDRVDGDDTRTQYIYITLK